ncbi:hypothetical protein [Aeromonas jandaei]|uniref:hypothetical protein n=1 Tax=Aeromonas jandaei TaxID=650 RepID=UPI003BA0D9A8
MKINIDTLHNYLIATFENARDHELEQPRLMYLIHQMEKIFQQEVFAHDLDISPTTGFLAMNSYLMLMSTVRQALSGHAASVFPIARVALESASYAYLCACDEAIEKVWLQRHTSRNALAKCRRELSVTKAVGKLKSLSPEMAEFVMSNYEASIDFGAHPNRKSVFNHLIDAGQIDDKYHGFELVGIYGKNSREVNKSLLVCIDVGQAIAFLIAASAKKHPLIYDHLDVFQNWIDEKNKVIEEITGEPIDYEGPMYSSVISPA